MQVGTALMLVAPLVALEAIIARKNAEARVAARDAAAAAGRTQERVETALLILRGACGCRLGARPDFRSRASARCAGSATSSDGT
jgi:hypothetical protein